MPSAPKCPCARFTFVCRDAPRSKHCQTPNPRPCHQPNATTPPARLHGASKTTAGTSSRKSLNGSGFGQKEAGHRKETIWVITRPLRQATAHVMGGGERYRAACAPSLGRRGAHRGGGVKPLQSQSLHRWTRWGSSGDNRLLLSRYLSWRDAQRGTHKACYHLSVIKTTSCFNLWCPKRSILWFMTMINCITPEMRSRDVNHVRKLLLGLLWWGSRPGGV